MKSKITLSINRIGSFTIKEAQFDASQCGKVGKQDYKYEVSIVGSGDTLDSEGFILDNMIVDEYFQKTYSPDGLVCGRVCRSCEKMACDAIEYFKSLFFGEDATHKNVSIARIKVTLRGSDHSWITGVWRNPKFKI